MEAEQAVLLAELVDLRLGRHEIRAQHIDFFVRRTEAVLIKFTQLLVEYIVQFRILETRVLLELLQRCALLLELLNLQLQWKHHDAMIL